MYFEMDGESMMFSALPDTPHEMENAMHPYELPQIHYTVVRLSLIHILVLVLVLVVIMFAVNTNGVMLLPQNVNNLVAQNAYVFILATGMLLSCLLYTSRCV